ncbi:MAG: alpha-L-fucosidase [Isosphaeraceae bacterium]
MSRSETLWDAARPRGIAAVIALLTIVLGGPVRSQPPSGPSASGTERNASARRWYQDARFGLSIHWGVYTLLSKGEWVMENDKLPLGEYARLPPRFNPAKFDADAWVKLARSAGARYITVTSKDHDGFCMFASKLTDYDIVDATPYRTDPMKALADACRDQNIKLFFYYSLLDWHHRDYFPAGKTGNAAGRAPGGDWKRYVAYYQGQVRELCTNYGEIGGIWFDGWWDRPDADWDLAGTYRLIHELQPGALVSNNHRVAPLPGEDFQILEQDLPVEDVGNKAATTADLPRETGMTINNSRGYNAADTRYKSAEQIIRALIGAAGRGGNLLLNVGPRPDGTIGPETRQRLVDVGKWLAANGDSVYGTRLGPIAPQPWGVSTAKGSKDRPTEIYLHILKPEAQTPIVLNEATASWTPYLFGKDRPLKLTPTTHGMALSLPEDAVMPIDTIVVLRPPVLGR